MVSTHLKNISQIGSFPQGSWVKIKNDGNHHPVYNNQAKERLFQIPKKMELFKGIRPRVRIFLLSNCGRSGDFSVQLNETSDLCRLFHCAKPMIQQEETQNSCNVRFTCMKSSNLHSFEALKISQSTVDGTSDLIIYHKPQTTMRNGIFTLQGCQTCWLKCWKHR